MAEGQWRKPTVELENFLPTSTQAEIDASWMVAATDCQKIENTAAAASGSLPTENGPYESVGHRVERQRREQQELSKQLRATEIAKTDKEEFDLTLIPYEALRRLGAVFKEGIEKYGRHNWRYGVGDKPYQLERANHAIKHLLLYVQSLQFAGELQGEEGEDNLAKVMWFCATQAELERLTTAERRRIGE